MSAIEIVGGAILLAASVVIIVLTLMQHTHVRACLVRSTAAHTAQTTHG